MAEWTRESLQGECQRQADIHGLQAASDRALGHLSGSRFHDERQRFWASLAHELARAPITVGAASAS